MTRVLFDSLSLDSTDCMVLPRSVFAKGNLSREELKLMSDFRHNCHLAGVSIHFCLSCGLHCYLVFCLMGDLGLLIILFIDLLDD